MTVDVSSVWVLSGWLVVVMTTPRPTVVASALTAVAFLSLGSHCRKSQCLVACALLHSQELTVVVGQNGFVGHGIGVASC